MTTAADLTPAELDDYEERAGILEYQAHMSRKAAEAMALRLVVTKRDKQVRLPLPGNAGGHAV